MTTVDMLMRVGAGVGLGAVIVNVALRAVGRAVDRRPGNGVEEE